MNIDEAFTYAKTNYDIEITKIKILLNYITGFNNAQLLIHNDCFLNDTQINAYKEALEQLKQGYPIQYITHKQEFFGMTFYVDDNVLIPQPDTEISIEKALELINSFENNNPKVLDLCTGSGAIGISIAKNSNAELWASDISEAAINIAKENANNNVADIHFILSNMFENIHEKDFDIIISNPPYIETNTINTLDKEVQMEPHLALDGGKDGLDFYRVIARHASSFLKDDGILILEIGYSQKDSVINLLEENFKNIKSYKDYAGNDRVIIAYKK